MKLEKIQRLGGFAVIIGAVLLAAWSILHTILLPNFAHGSDITPLILNPHFCWLELTALLAVLFLVFGFAAIYSRFYSSSGVLGFIGYVFVTLAYILQIANSAWALLIFPLLAKHELLYPLFGGKIYFNDTGILIFQNMFLAVMLIGVVTFSIALIRSREFSKISGILFLTGVVLYGIGPMISEYVAVFGVFILASGCALLGLRLLRPSIEKAN
ncbi:MAG: hypothetical protein JW841_18065 [Deltaproteobacteria bacterium]|nr:hypothetical protein [Deltaproteobacteria bacterium]